MSLECKICDSQENFNDHNLFLSGQYFKFLTMGLFYWLATLALTQSNNLKCCFVGCFFFLMQVDFFVFQSYSMSVSHTKVHLIKYPVCTGDKTIHLLMNGRSGQIAPRFPFNTLPPSSHLFCGIS